MDEILSFGVSAILSSRDGGHLGTLYRFLTDDGFRENYLKSVEDEFIVETWRNRFAKLPETAIAPVLRRLTRFLRDPILRNIVSHKKSSIDFRRIMDEGKVLLVKLPSGKIGTDNTYMLGSLIISRLHAAALTREDIPENERRPFYLYIDEFQNFICKSVEESIYGTRKFNLGLMLANHTIQELQSRDKDVAQAVLASRTRICFQVGDEDASDLAKGFLDYTPHDLQNLRTGEAIVRVGGSVNSFEIMTRYEPAPPEEIVKRRREELIRYTQARYGFGAHNKPEPETTCRVIPLSTRKDVMRDWVDKKEEAQVKLEGAKNVIPEKKEAELDHEEREIPERGEIALKLEEKNFLEFLSQIEGPLPVRQVYKRLKLGVKKGAGIKDALLEKMLITETDIRLEKTSPKSKILTLTLQGYEALHIPLPPGKGGVLHKTFQSLVARCAVTIGYKAVIEEQASNGKLVDVGLQKDGKKIALEISVTTRSQQVLENIMLDLEGGYHEVIVVCIEAKALAKIRSSIIEKLTQREYPKVHFCLVNELEDYL